MATVGALPPLILLQAVKPVDVVTYQYIYIYSSLYIYIYISLLLPIFSVSSLFREWVLTVVGGEGTLKKEIDPNHFTDASRRAKLTITSACEGKNKMASVKTPPRPHGR